MDPIQGLRLARIRGTAPSSSDATSRRFPTGRVCSATGCTTRLSIYNAKSSCWLHEAPTPFLLRASARQDHHAVRKAG
jgi:hypothetical protein